MFSNGGIYFTARAAKLGFVNLLWSKVIKVIQNKVAETRSSKGRAKVSPFLYVRVSISSCETDIVQNLNFLYLDICTALHSCVPDGHPVQLALILEPNTINFVESLCVYHTECGGC